jgi:tRNA(Ile2)-agmatinylcytidine synthase
MHSERKQYPSDPGMTLFIEKPDEIHYWNAVRGESGFIEGGHQWGGQGRIGAAASCAWSGDTATWEGIAWRKGERSVSEESLTIVDEMDGTFLCRDSRTRRGLIAPRGECPVMFGVRATSSDVALEATKELIRGSAETTGFRIFRTNQASGDHIEKIYQSTVETKEILTGGHVILNKNILAFSESGDLNKLAQWLEEGDSFEYYGLEYDGDIHLEGLKVTNSKSYNRPICDCGTRMKSMGKEQGVRCPKCKTKSDQVWVESERIPPATGWAHPPVDKRRHLAKTL